MINIQLILTFLFLWLTIFFNEGTENYVASIFILSLGILHGANDIEIGKKTLLYSKKLSNKYVLLTLYIISILIISLLLFRFPLLTLILFLVLSSFHFGEQHWSSLIKIKSKTSNLFMLSYGLLIFNILFKAHTSLVIQIIKEITSFRVNEETINILLVSSFFTTIILYLTIFKKTLNFKFSVKQLFYLLLFFVVFNSASLIWAFAIYFILWHSLPSLLDQMLFLYGKKDYNSFLKFFKEGFIYWFIALLSLTTYYFVLKSYYKIEISMFFAFLTALTIPHIFLMFFLKSKKTNI